MFGIEARVPVHSRVVKAEEAVLDFHFNVHVGVASQELVAEGAVFALGADFVNFVDDGADSRVFVQNDGGD